jgi:predicted nucleotidyltransferase
MKTPQSEKLKQIILDVISTKADIRLAILFGSLAIGKGHQGSDLDLAVDAGRSITVDEKMAIISELAQKIGRPVDLVDLHGIGEPLLGQILSKGKRILGSDSLYGNLLSKHLFEQADFLPYRKRILDERRIAWIGK